MEAANAAADAQDEHHRSGREPEREAHEKSRRSHAEREAEQVAHRQVEQPVGDEGYRHDDFHVLDAAQDADRDVLHAVGQLVERREEHQFRGNGDDFGIRGEERRNPAVEGDEAQGGKGVPGQYQMVRRPGRQRQFPDVARPVAVRDADGRRRADGHDNHEGAVAQRHGNLVGAERLLAEPAHHDAGADEGRGLEEHL